MLLPCQSFLGEEFVNFLTDCLYLVLSQLLHFIFELSIFLYLLGYTGDLVIDLLEFALENINAVSHSLLNLLILLRKPIDRIQLDPPMLF